MSEIRPKDTGPEIMLRSHLSKAGLRYRLYKRDLPGTPDIVFVSKKVAVFCDGDFWHGRRWQWRKQRQFKVRRQYWVDKIEENMRRDKRVNQRLRRKGWKVLRYWESEIKDNGLKIAKEVTQVLRKRKVQ